MKKNIKKFLEGNRLLYLIARKIQRFVLKYRNPIRGNNNKIIKKGILLNVKFDIEGNDNIIEISKGYVLSDMKIYMRGNNHYL